MENLLREYDDIIKILTDFFGDENKAVLWMSTRNPLLGGATPVELMLMGRTHKLTKFIHNAIDENRSPT